MHRMLLNWSEIVKSHNKSTENLMKSSIMPSNHYQNMLMQYIEFSEAENLKFFNRENLIAFLVLLKTQIVGTR